MEQYDLYIDGRRVLRIVRSLYRQALGAHCQGWRRRREACRKCRSPREEVFGLVLAVLPFEDDEEAIRIANSLPYGLAAGVWTENMARALTMAKRLEAGTVWVNTYRAVSYMVPFGGFKRSGLGRESGMEMIKEYLQTKSVWIAMGNEVLNPFVLR